MQYGLRSTIRPTPYKAIIAPSPKHCCEGDRRRSRCLDCGQVRIDKEYG
ncbi:MAG: hypothetical protein NTZ09_13235 [Candidatus Hydrogenedentes bacterium]|nr:hypothetical protein [Candidatus Hydrogenedentota bacterium]